MLICDPVLLLWVATLRCANCVACKAKWESRYNMANEEHKHLGVRGINPFQASGLLSYQCVASTWNGSHVIV